MDFDVDDKIIIGRVIDIADIIAFHGASAQEFEATFKTAVDGSIHAYGQLGQDAEKLAKTIPRFC